MNELLSLPATELARRIWKKDLSAREVVDAHIARIEHVNRVINAVVATDYERARRTA